ncbi:putative p22 protein precursor [Trypanosoma conorhini]|uniref:Putative p22 protein n=1 Tax=Trypanosoma conorhini TaxID=83891 RepID=A0A3R7R3D6_9TRYP|nr:putative p22 protein precursor [Trypanosoma conorhini]RNE95394.1 putative p22 protein precursor [Trypanosoma conorhini]
MSRLLSYCQPRSLTRLFSHVSEACVRTEEALQPAKRRVLPRRHRKLHMLTVREENEEGLRDFLPPKPAVPAGWKLEHVIGSNSFDLRKTVEIRDCGKEDLHVLAMMELKEYEGTYRMDNGEREEEEYLFFTLFIQKHRFQGALEFGLTSIDMELVMDSLAIHSNRDELDDAYGALSAGANRNSLSVKGSEKSNLFCRRCRDARYRGPMMSELDDDFSDEILDYLDERGVNNGFAEYMMAQAHFFEQEEYINWLRLLRQFAQ